MKHFQIMSANEAKDFQNLLVDYKFIVFDKTLTGDAIDKSEIKDWVKKYVTDYNPDTNDYMKYEVKSPAPSNFNYFKTYVLDCIEDDVVEVQKFTYTVEDYRQVFEMTLMGTVTWDMQKLQELYKDGKVQIICSAAPTEIIYYGIPFKKSEDGSMWVRGECIFDKEDE